MVRTVFVGLLIICLFGCKPEQEVVSAPQVEDNENKPLSGDERSGVVDNELSDPLVAFTERLVDEGPGVFRYDRVRDSRSGRERQVYIEILGLSDQEAAELSTRVMNSLGLESGHSFGDENGVRLSFRAENGELIRILVRSRDAHANLLNDEATSSVYLTFPVN